MTERKALLHLSIILVLLSCTQNLKYEFNPVLCTQSPCPEFDGKIVSIIDPETGNAIKDTLIEKIPKRCKVFPPCRRFIYEAIYRDENDNLISKSFVSMIVTGKRWNAQPEKQDEAIIQYSGSDADLEKLRRHFVNEKFRTTTQFMQEVDTGLIENEQEVWMHPFRSNQFNFTEIAPFPSVEFPLSIDKVWQTNLSIGNGWGDWEGVTVNSEYQVAGKTEIETPFRTFACWKINSSSNSTVGVSEHVFFFNEEYGFVKMNYKNYKGQTLVFDLVDVSNN